MERDMQMGAPAGGNRVGGGTTAHTGTNGTRLAALTGVVFAVALAANFIGNDEPSSTASAAKVAHYYLAHKDAVNLRALFGAAAVLFGLGFFSYLRTYLRRVSSDAITDLYFTGVLVFAIGGVIGAGMQFTLGDSPKSLSPQSLQALNMLASDLNWPIISIGLALMYLALGIIVIRSRIIPVWLGWLAILVAIAGGSLFFAFVPLLVTPVWVLVISIVMAVRNPRLSKEPANT